jgi:hypothetical protein
MAVSTQLIVTLLLSAYSTYKLLSAYSTYQHHCCQHTAYSNTTVSIQHVQTLLLWAYSMYQHYYCQHTARKTLLLSAHSMYPRHYCQHTAYSNITTVSIQHVQTLLLSAHSNITTVSIQHVPTSLLSVHSLQKHYYCQHAARTNITIVSTQLAVTLLLSAYSTYKHYYCQPITRTSITTVSTQNIPASSVVTCLCVTTIQHTDNALVTRQKHRYQHSWEYFMSPRNTDRTQLPYETALSQIHEKCANRCEWLTEWLGHTPASSGYKWRQTQLAVVTVEVWAVLCEVRAGDKEVLSIDHVTQLCSTTRQRFERWN